jgi:hypothetical protein
MPSPSAQNSQQCASVIENERYREFTASLRVWGAALERIRQQGKDAGTNAEIPDFIGVYFNSAIDAGYGEENVMALSKMLKQWLCRKPLPAGQFPVGARFPANEPAECAQHAR